MENCSSSALGCFSSDVVHLKIKSLADVSMNELQLQRTHDQHWRNIQDHSLFTCYRGGARFLKKHLSIMDPWCWAVGFSTPTPMHLNYKCIIFYVYTCIWAWATKCWLLMFPLKTRYCQELELKFSVTLHPSSEETILCVFTLLVSGNTMLMFMGFSIPKGKWAERILDTGIKHSSGRTAILVWNEKHISVDISS